MGTPELHARLRQRAAWRYTDLMADARTRPRVA